MSERHLFTSESVTEGHPDKVADQISDGILDAMLAQDPRSRVACETMVTTGVAIVSGEVTTEAYVEIPDIVTTGRTIHVPADGNLQAALDEATGGDRITLEPRATYKGPFRLRRKTGDGWIVVTSAATDLPKPGRSVKPSDAARMPRIVASSGSVLQAEPGAHHYRLVGLEITPEEGTSLVTLVQLGGDETTVDAVPHHVIIESAHPSPLSARSGFFGSKPFSKINAALRAAGTPEIDWRIS